MVEREKARKEIRTTPGDKWIALQKCKSLMNRVTKQVREEVIKYIDQKFTNYFPDC